MLDASFELLLFHILRASPIIIKLVENILIFLFPCGGDAIWFT